MDNLIYLLPAVLILAIMMLLSMPIYIAILATALYIQVFVTQVPLESVFNGLFESITKTSLIAVPFFVLTGSLIEASSMGSRLINCFMVLLKNVRAGLPISCLLANAVFGAISGSAPAAAATFGKVTYSPLKQAYGENLSIGLITSSGALSTIIPPSIVMIIFGVATDTSIADLFKGAFIPGLIIVLIVGSYLFFVCKKNAPGEEEAGCNSIRDTYIKAVPVLLLPVIILGGIYAGVYTPTEAGAVAAVYSAGVAFFIYKDLKLGDLPRILSDSVRITAQIFILIATSTVLAQAFTFAQVPQMITESFRGLEPFMFLFILNILLLIVGCFFDPASAILILAPLILPAARSLGIDPLHLGIVFTINLSIGMFTPPFGMNIYVMQSILKKPLELISGAVLPYIVLYIVGLIIITYIPRLTLWLPGLLKH